MKEIMEMLGRSFEEIQELQIQPSEHNMRILTGALSAMRAAYHEMAKLMKEQKPEEGGNKDG